MRSRIHVGSSAIQCPWCKEGFVTASGVTVHLESGNCTASDLNRQKLNHLVTRMDRNNIITKPLLTMPGYEDNCEIIATEKSWNGYGFECYLCDRQFGQLYALNQHLRSPAHDQNLYRCPERGCRREYKVLSGLIMHFESESCGFVRFSSVQQLAQNGIQNMVGKMITG